MSGTTTPTSDLSSFLGEDPGVARLYDNVQVMMPGAPLSVVKMAAWNAVEEFYLQSTSRRELVHWQMAAGVQSVDFNPFDATWLVAWVLNVGGLSRFRVRPPGEVLDLEYPASVREGSALLALKPVSFNTTMPPELWSTWFEVILDGTLGRLYAMPAKPYTSPQMAQYHGARFRRGIARARDIAQREWTDGPGRWNFPRMQGFAMGRRKN